MNYLKPELISALAGEYVLGSLKGRARSRFERLMAAEPLVQREVAKWQARLQPLADRLDPVEPSERVWKRIEKRIRPAQARSAAAADAAAGSGAFGQLVSAWWRRLALGSSALAGVLVAVLLLRPPAPAPTVAAAPPNWDMWSILLSADNKPHIIVCASKSSRRLWVMVNRPQTVAADRSLELWMMPADGSGQPKSLGLVPTDGVHQIQLATTVQERVAGVPVLAVSLEPAGGSRSGAPTGPVLYSGPVLFKKTT
jgi:anti-sigma-K factor RskA